MTLFEQFQGRAGRNEFYLKASIVGWRGFAVVIFGIVAWIGCGALTRSAVIADLVGGTLIVGGLGLMTFHLSALCARRAHDLGVSGWWGLTAGLQPLVFVAWVAEGGASWSYIILAADCIIGAISSWILSFTPGSPQANRFGDPPKEGKFSIFGPVLKEPTPAPNEPPPKPRSDQHDAELRAVRQELEAAKTSLAAKAQPPR